MARKRYGNSRRNKNLISNRISGNRVAYKFEQLPGGDTRKHTDKCSYGHAFKKRRITSKYTSSLIMNTNTGKVIVRKSNSNIRKRDY